MDSTLRLAATYAQDPDLYVNDANLPLDRVNGMAVASTAPSPSIQRATP